MSGLRAQIQELWDRRESLSVDDSDANAVIHDAIGLLDTGEARVAELGDDGGVVVNEWLKLAILLLFRQSQMSTIRMGPFEYADKIPLKTLQHAASASCPAPRHGGAASRARA